ncbi:MAG: MvdC family ATP-grasp ribosomal peptide maturase [Deltaproteobacteria bacterium]|nr:MvdC family ATP-grasp ribosomal peptide maturase [Deltaproteobacteria bacterium]
MRDAVLLLTHSGDFFTIDRVAEAVASRGARPIRLDTNRFPQEAELSARLGQSGLTHRLKYRGQVVLAEEVRAAWLRRIWTPDMEEDLEPSLRETCCSESSAALYGFLDGLHEARWIDRQANVDTASDKLYQLRMARAAGLRIPETLVTNSAEEARDFFAGNRGNVVAKLFTPVSMSMGPAERFVYTSRVTADDIEQAEGLRHCPMVFQEHVAKSVELRIAHVAGKLFIGAIDASRSQKGQVDWRQAEPGACEWQHHDGIPHDVERRLLAFMDLLGLTYGAIDMIVTPDGDHVFLEVNPGGEWGMLEKHLGLPISQAIADALVS